MRLKRQQNHNWRRFSFDKIACLFKKINSTIFYKILVVGGISAILVALYFGGRYYARKYLVNPQTLIIDIDYKNYQRIAYKRHIALEKGMLFTDASDYVPAKIRYQGKQMKVDLRLKGDLPGHWEGKKWSFRIKVKGENTFKGMKKFSIQHPRERNYIHEWFYHKLLKKEGLIALRYDFIRVVVNGKNLGIYAIEEHFDKYLVENNQRREGPILKLNEDILWEDRYIHGSLHNTDLQSFYALNIDAFKMGTIFKKPDQRSKFILARNLLEAFQRGELLTHEVFDIDQLAKFFAVSDLSGAHHGTAWHNMRFYYNPITSRLEPIGFDGDCGYRIGHVLGSLRATIFAPGSFNPFLQLFFKDEIFMEKYLSVLQRISTATYLDEVFNEFDKEIAHNNKLILSEFKKKRAFKKDPYLYNQKIIQNALNPIKSVNAHVHKMQKDVIELKLGNIQSLPVEILYLTDKKDRRIFPAKRTILSVCKKMSPIVYQNVLFHVPDPVSVKEAETNELKIHYKILGTSHVKADTIFLWPAYDSQFIEGDSIRQNPNVKDFEFIIDDQENRRFIIKPGTWDVAKTMIVPEGHQLVCGRQTTINLLNASKIISYSPVNFIGSEGHPIVIESTDASGQGLVVMNAKIKSRLVNVVFRNLVEPHENGWKLTGAVTFFQSPVEIDKCKFVSNKAEDSLNIIDSEFLVKRCVFLDAHSDAFDIDFGTGEIIDTEFYRSGNDAVDFSGSKIHLENINIDRAQDKGISIGEVSVVEAKRIAIKEASIAIATKDYSQLKIEEGIIQNSEAGFALYNKKAEYGQVFVIVDDVAIKDVKIPFVVEDGSELKVDGETIRSDQKEVREVLGRLLQ